MTDLDHVFSAMRAIPTDLRLEGMEQVVMAGMAQRKEQAVARRSFVLAAMLAISVGWAGSLPPSAPAQAAPMPIGMSDHAPSRLLGE
jgi:hypothetical protein